MSSTQHQLIEQCATRLRGIVEALDNIHDTSPHRWSTDLDDVHSSAESLLAMINDQAPAQDAQGLALRTIAEYPCPEQDNMTAANMRQVAADAITGALAFGAQASQPPAADHWLRPFYDIGRAEGQRTQELSMLVRMLASSLKRHAPESNLVARATNYLAAKGLAGTPLRDAPASVEQAGGDERAALQELIRVRDWVKNRRGQPEKLKNTGQTYIMIEKCETLDMLEWAIERARAALAQPSPVPELELPQSCGPTPDIDLSQYNLADVEGLQRWAFAATDELTAFDRIVGELRADRDSWAKRWDEAVRYGARIEEQRDAALARVAELEKGTMYVEARQCDECQHGGINDSADGLAACHDCDWTGPEPDEDRCPGCHRENCMTAACPACGGRYVLVASDDVTAPVAQAQHSVPEGYALIPVRETEAMHDAVMALLYKGVARTDTQKLLDAYIAAAPGKEGM
ncbi:hypothetical protein ACEPW5_09640 [Pseudomonas aeruginosa]